MAIHSEAMERVTDYAESHGLTLIRRIGWGKDGVVFETSRGTVVKALAERRPYFNEISVYLRLLDRKVQFVEGFEVPILRAFDDELMIIEMGIVSPPCVLDFANAGLDGPLHDFPLDVLAAQEAENEEVFEERWPTVVRIRSALRRLGIHIADLNPNNIMFPPEK
jgi:hypothetical protein